MTVRALDRVDPRQARAVERGRRDDQHRHVDHPGEPHGDEDVDPLEAEQPPALGDVTRADPVLGEGRVEVDHVRHHGRAEDADREQYGLATGEPGHQGVSPDRAERRVGHEELGDVADADHADDRGDHRLERPEAEALQREDRERRDARDHGRREEGHAE